MTRLLCQGWRRGAWRGLYLRIGRGPSLTTELRRIDCNLNVQRREGAEQLGPPVADTVEKLVLVRLAVIRSFAGGDSRLLIENVSS